MWLDPLSGCFEITDQKLLRKVALLPLLAGFTKIPILNKAQNILITQSILPQID
jgi:hypothetical protein